MVLLYDRDDREIAELARSVAGQGTRTIEIPLRGTDADYRLDLTLDGFELEHRGTLLTDQDLRAADLVVYRRHSTSNPPPVTVPGLAGDSRRFAEREWSAALWGALVGAERRTVGVTRWCNPPSLDELLRNKLVLLASARAAGMPVPDLRVGNYTLMPPGDQFVVKAVNSDEVIGPDRRFMTADFPPDLAARYRGERVPAPTLVQAKVDLAHEIRCYVVGETALAYRLTVPDGVVDSRVVPAGDLEVDPVRLDDAVSRRLVTWTRQTGLLYCAFDLLVSRDGIHLLVDVNPNGSWGWYSEALPQIASDISAAFCRLAAG